MWKYQLNKKLGNLTIIVILLNFLHSRRCISSSRNDINHIFVLFNTLLGTFFTLKRIEESWLFFVLSVFIHVIKAPTTVAIRHVGVQTNTVKLMV